MLTSLSRRQLLQQAAIGTVATLSAASWSRVYGANEKLRVASIGNGGKGWDDLNQVAASPQVRIVALCDVDTSEPFMGRAAKKFDEAKTLTDYRQLLDQAALFDAAIVSTPDHMHAPIALPAMQLGKHVFCQKPLTHTVREARAMQDAAKKYNVVTQMGNQIQSYAEYRTAVRAVHDGVIGQVQEVHSWQAGKMGWLPDQGRPPGSDRIPSTLQWDAWLGVAPERPYKEKLYHSFNWRGWQDFSNGQLGDFGCHILDPVFMALHLTAPTIITADAPPHDGDRWTKMATVHYEFPGTKLTAAKTLKVTWYDGEGKSPDIAALGLPPETKLPGSGSLLLGTKGTLLIPHVGMPRLLKGEGKIEPVAAVNHYTGWADACRGVGQTTSAFSYSGNLTETVLLGSIAIRLPKAKLQWDHAELKLTGHAQASALLSKEYRKGWEPKLS